MASGYQIVLLLSIFREFIDAYTKYKDYYIYVIRSFKAEY
jgi:hypothetical protein